MRQTRHRLKQQKRESTGTKERFREEGAKKGGCKKKKRSAWGGGKKSERARVRGREKIMRERELLAFHQRRCDQYQCLTGQRCSLYRKSLPIMMERLNHAHTITDPQRTYKHTHTYTHVDVLIHRAAHFSTHTNIRYLCPESAFPKNRQ